MKKLKPKSMAKMPYILPESSREYVEVLNRVIQNDAGHGDTSHGISHIDAGIWEIACSIHNFFILNILIIFITPPAETTSLFGGERSV